jgi:hypothetical protein
LAERGGRAVDLVGQHHAGRHPGGVRRAELLQREGRLGLEGEVEGNRGRGPTLVVVRPSFGEVEPGGDRQTGGIVGHRQADQHLAVVDLAQLAGICCKIFGSHNE